MYTYTYVCGCVVGLSVVLNLLICENGKKAKKMTARNEREASEADLKAAKMQVEATDAAEETKKRLEKTM